MGAACLESLRRDADILNYRQKPRNMAHKSLILLVYYLYLGLPEIKFRAKLFSNFKGVTARRRELPYRPQRPAVGADRTAFA